MPNFPSIHDELRALWNYLQNFQTVTVNQETRLQNLETKLTCVSYITSPTNSTVFNCDVRLSGSGDPDLYVDGDITTKSNLIVSGSTTIGSTNTTQDKLTINVNSNTDDSKFTINGLSSAPNGTSFLILSGSGNSVKKFPFSDFTAALFESGSFSPTIEAATDFTGKSYTRQYGEYLKIGPFIYVMIDMTVSVGSKTGSGNVYIGGLPYETKDNPGFSVMGKWLEDGNLEGYPVTNAIYFTINGNGWKKFKITYVDETGTTDVDALDIANGSTHIFMVQFMYITGESSFYINRQ